MERHRIDKAALRETITSLEGLTNEQKADLLQLLSEQKRYGLVWEDHAEDVEEQLRTQLPVLCEDSSKRILSADEEAPNHILIEGDNLHALTALTYTHEGRVDVIYIDPPYNTGNKDFVYNDSFVDSEDGYRHSKWLSFMHKRLKIAKRLLSDRGVIFISIDDNEQANLKLLCDEVFGMQNYISSIPWHSRQSMQNDTDFSINHEYIICFAKNRRQTNRRLKPSNADVWFQEDGFVFYPCKVDNNKFSNPDNDKRGPWKADPFDAPNVRPNLTYEIVNPNTGRSFLPPSGRHWRMSGEKFEAALADDRIIFGKNGTSKPQLKVFLNELEDYGSVPNSWFEAEVYKTATHGSKELQEVFGGDKPFTSPKPIELIRELLNMVTLPEKPAIILDFFAGSGTTLHATMQLNAEDGGHRQCILVTNNENGICENVTYERNRRVIQGYTTPKGVEVPGLSGNNLRYYRTDFVERENTHQNRKRLMEASVDLVCLREGVYHEEERLAGRRINTRIMRYFTEGERQLLFVFEPAVIPQLAQLLPQVATLQCPLRLYVFSDGAYAYEDELRAVADRIEVCALPNAIRQAYKSALPRPIEKELESVNLEETVEP